MLEVIGSPPLVAAQGGAPEGSIGDEDIAVITKLLEADSLGAAPLLIC